MTIAFRVDGVPVPQGSLRGYVVGGHAVVTHDARPTLGAWRQSIAARASEATAGADPIVDPVALELRFGVRRPRHHYGVRGGVTNRWSNAIPTTAPDLDKLARAVLDALSGILFRDDAQVVELVAVKAYAERPGVEVVARPAESALTTPVALGGADLDRGADIP